VRLFVIAAIWMLGAGQLMAQPAEAPAAGQSVWSGIYSEAQAYRGEKVADTVCLGCHGAGLQGGDSGPRLVGETFLSAWNNRSVADLFDYIAQTMPENAPGTLKPEDVASAIAYLLKQNSMPSGGQELLPAREALAPITILAVQPAP
jgi:alcohol dehydrogenase (cytochrome c)